MSKNKFRIILFLMSVALIGIVSLQYAMIKDSYVQKQQLFDQNVNAALVDVVKKVEKLEALDFIQMKSDRINKIYVKQQNDFPVMELTGRVIPDLENIERKKQLELERKQTFLQRSQNRMRVKADSLQKIANEFEFTINDKSFEMNIPDVRVWEDSNGFKKFSKSLAEDFTILNDSIVSYFSYTSPEVPKKRSKPSRPTSRVIVRSDFHNEAPPAPPEPPAYLQGPIMIFNQDETPKRKAAKTFLDKQKNTREEVLKDLAAELDALNVPLEKRINPQLIDSFLVLELRKRGIYLEFDLLIKNNSQHKVFFTNVEEDIEPQHDYYSAVLFENVGKEEAPYINIAFPDKQKMLSEQMGSVLASSTLLLLVLLACFVYTLQAILKQKKLSDLKNDFINNMTHEFKTPVSTILLASEALKDPSVVKDEPRVHRLASIIYDENLRLGEHVERVLNMARMDKGEIKLAMNSVSLHDTISEVLQHMDLSLNSKKQTIQLELTAENDLVYADAFHLKNIVQNLIDNASKYSSTETKIVVSTEVQHKFVCVKVRDFGIGMKKDQVKKIFEPFYRVPTGNLHDVKGFGIGLHYVYSILKAMGGKISVKSEIGLGSEFSILLPREL